MLRVKSTQVVLLAGFFCAALMVRDGTADESQEFRRRYEQALSLYDKGQYQESLQEFQTAYAIKQLPKLLLNMGQVHRKLGHAKDALGYYELYLRVEPNPEAKLKAELDRYIQQTRAMLEAAKRVRADTIAAGKHAEQERAQDQPLGKTAIPIPDEKPATPTSGEHPLTSTLPASVTGPQPQPTLDLRANAAMSVGPPESRSPLPAPNWPVYKRPWFWGVMAAVGVVAVTGIVTATVLGTRGPGIPDNIQIQNWSLGVQR